MYIRVDEVAAFGRVGDQHGSEAGTLCNCAVFREGFFFSIGFFMLHTA